MSDRIGDAFLDGTKIENLGPSDQQAGVSQPPLHVVFREGRRVLLPEAASLHLGDAPLREVVEKRRSLRTYSEAPLTIEELSFLCWCTQGVKPESTDKYTLRTVPSAGARHAFETVLSIQRVRDLPSGLYQYDAAAHGLIAWPSPEDAADRLTAACLGQSMVRQGAATFIWVAERARMAWRYGERGVRYLFLDAGHVCQNLHLAAESIDAGACAIGAFSDDDINGLLGFDGTHRFVVYVAAVGKRVD
jgi:SagB-type dehydrogenase family enzyme